MLALAPTRAPHPNGTRTVADAMMSAAKVHGARATVGELRMLFDDSHVHAAVIVEDGLLLAVVDRDDLTGHPDHAVAVHLGRLRSRVIAPACDLGHARQLMLADGRRRLAVVEPGGRLIGLLCLKRTRAGFCSDRDVHARRSDGRH